MGVWKRRYGDDIGIHSRERDGDWMVGGMWHLGMNDLSDGHRVLLKRIRNESLAKLFSLSSLLFFFWWKKKREKKGAKGKRLDAPIYKTHYMSTWWNGHLPSLWGLWCAWLLAHRADTAESKKRNRFVLQAFLSFYLFLFLKVVRTTCPVCVQLVLLLLSFLFLDCRLRNATRYWKK